MGILALPKVCDIPDRNWVQARTGLLGKGQTKTFSYNHVDPLQCRDKKIAEAWQWVRQMWAKDDLPVNF
jgi:hypothetical protein